MANSINIFIFTVLSVLLTVPSSYAKIYCDDGCVQFKVVVYPDYAFNQTSRRVFWNDTTCRIESTYHDPREYTNDTVRAVRVYYDDDGLELYNNGHVLLYVDVEDFSILMGILGDASIPFVGGTYYIDGCEPCLKKKNLKTQECSGIQYVDWSSWNYSNCTGKCNCLKTLENLRQLCGEGSIVNWNNQDCTGECISLFENLGVGAGQGVDIDTVDPTCQN